MLDKTITEDAAIPKTHSLNSTITEGLQKHADLKKQLARISQLKKTYVIPVVLSTVGITADYMEV